MKTLLRKEFLWNWRSFRFPALLLVFLFHALLDPVMIRYLPEIMARFGEVEMALPDMGPEEAFHSFLSSVSQIGILVLIFVSMSTVAKEKMTGVAGWMLSKPVSRRNYLAAKLINLYVVIVAGLSLTATIAYFYTWFLLGRIPAAGAAWATVSLIVFTLFIGSLVFFLSTVLRTPLQAGGLGVLIFFLSGALLMVVRETAARQFYPNTLLSEMGRLVAGVSGPAEIAGPLAVTLALSLLLVVLAGLRFNRAEL